MTPDDLRHHLMAGATIELSHITYSGETKKLLFRLNEGLCLKTLVDTLMYNGLVGNSLRIDYTNKTLLDISDFINGPKDTP